MKVKALALITIIFFLSAGFAAAKALVINLGYASSEGSSHSVLADNFEKFAEEYSNNTIDLKVRCCTQLATEDEAFKALQAGSVDMYIITGNNVAPHYPLMDAFVLPYIFQNKDHAYKVLEGDIGKKFAEDFQKKTKVHLLTFGFVGDRDFYNSIRPINTMADMKGLKIRVPKNKVMIDTFKAFGAAPIPLAWAETPTALQTGAVDGGDNGTSFIKSQKFYEICGNLSILEHFSYFTPLFASPKIMKKLTDEQRVAVLRAGVEAGKKHKNIMTREVNAVRVFLGNEGKMAVTTPDKEEFIKAAEDVQNIFMSDRNDAFKDLVMAIRAEGE